MSQNVFARHIEIDHVKHEIRIDGALFPYYIETDPEVATHHDGMIGAARIGIFAERVTVITPENPGPAVDEVTKSWIDHTVNRLIEAKMSDQLRWLRASGRIA